MMLNLAVGPVMMDQDIRDIGSEQIPYFRTDEFSQIMLENESMLIECTKAPKNCRAVFLTASGTAAMEATIVNILSKKDKVLVVNGGSFGKRFKQICDVYELDADEIKLNYFEQITNEHLQPYEGQRYTALLVNVHETSTGVLYDMSVIKDFCLRNKILLIVDAISSFLADYYDMKYLGASVTILSSQKALALPPGMSYVILDSEAQKRVNNNSMKCFYFNFKDYLRDGLRGQTPYTPAVSILLQLNKRLKIIQYQGVDKIINDVKEIAEDFRESLANLPLEIASKTPSNALTPITCHGNMTAYEITKYLKDEHDIFVVPNGGDLAEKVFRVGHIGAIKLEDNMRLIRALESMYREGIL